MKKVGALLIVTCLFVGLTLAAAEGEREVRNLKQQEGTPTPKGVQARPGRISVVEGRGQTSVNPQERSRQMLSMRAEVHKQAIDELEAIKKIAVEEGATRTVEALQKMISEKKADYQESIKQVTQQQKERMEQIQKRMGQEGASAKKKTE